MRRRKSGWTSQSFQRRKVKDFFIKIKKKLHFAGFLTEQSLDLVLQRFFACFAEMNMDKVGGLPDGFAEGGLCVDGFCFSSVHSIPPVK